MNLESGLAAPSAAWAAAVEEAGAASATLTEPVAAEEKESFIND